MNLCDLYLIVNIYVWGVIRGKEFSPVSILLREKMQIDRKESKRKIIGIERVELYLVNS